MSNPDIGKESLTLNRREGTPLRLLQIIGTLLLVAGVVTTVSLVGTAHAGTGPGTSGNTITNAAQAQQPFTAGTFDSGQPINVVIPPNGVLTAGSTIFVLECSAPNGVNPVNISSCDGNTAYAGGTITVQSDGSVDIINTSTSSALPYLVYALPDSVSLGEGSANLPKCGLGSANECVLYIGQGGGSDPGLSLPHFFSQPFQVHPDATDSGTVSPGDGTFPADSAPAITSANSTTFTQGSAGTFNVTATGYGPPTFTETGALPTGVTLTTTHSLNTSTGVLAGTTNQNGTFPITITADNGVSPPATQSFTLTVSSSGGGPTITSVNNTTFTQGSAGTFTVTATGSPAPTFNETGPLPTGVTLTSAGVLAGTPTLNGAFPITVTATNGVGSPGTQAFTLTVDAAPTITSANAATFTQGAAGTFTVTATGFPAPTFTETGPLPAGVTLTPAGVLAGTPTVPGSFPITFTAANGVGLPANQSFTLTVTPGTTLTVSATASTVTASPNPAVTGPEAGGTTVTVTLLTSDGTTPVPGKTVTLTPTSPSGNTSFVGPNTATSNSSGQATFSVIDSTVEAVTMTATDTTDSLPIVAITIVNFVTPPPPTISPTASTVTVSSATGPADGFTEILVSVTVINTSGQPVAGVHVTVAVPPTTSALVDPSASDATPGITDSSGAAHYAARDSAAEAVTFSATAGSVALSAHPTATFTAGTADALTSTVIANPAAVALNTASTVTVTLTDHANNGIAGKVITLTPSGGSSVIAPAQATTDVHGAATLTVTDAKDEIVTYSATDMSDTLPLSQLASVTFGTPPPVVPSQADSTAVANLTTVAGDGKTAATIKVTLRDTNGMPISGKIVSLSASGGSSVITVSTASPFIIGSKSTSITRPRASSGSPTATTGSNGAVYFDVTDATAEQVTYTATDSTDSLSGWTVSVTFTAATATTSTTAPGSGSTTTTTPPASSSSAGGATPTDGSAAGASGASSSTSGSGSSGPLLAFTGAPSALPWLFGFGALCLLLGTFARRVLVIRRREQ